MECPSAASDLMHSSSAKSPYRLSLRLAYPLLKVGLVPLLSFYCLSLSSGLLIRARHVSLFSCLRCVSIYECCILWTRCPVYRHIGPPLSLVAAAGFRSLVWYSGFRLLWIISFYPSAFRLCVLEAEVNLL